MYKRNKLDEMALKNRNSFSQTDSCNKIKLGIYYP